MENLGGELAGRLRELSAHWASYSLLGSFVLYILGYLTLRFHLTALGIGTDLSVLDERYLFTGARFLIYLVSSVPGLVFLVLLMAAPVYFLYRILPSAVRARLGSFFNRQWRGIASWLRVPHRLALGGIIFSLLMIQLLMRQCFLLNNLLLAEDLPTEPSWFRGLLLAQSDGPMALYFSALLAGAAISSGIFYALRNPANTISNTLPLTSLLGFLLFVQLLFIPVNYGILVVDKSMPRVTGLETPGTLQANEQAWLVWEGNEGKTFLLRKPQAGKYAKSLITLPRETIKKLEITGYDPIFKALFAVTALPRSAEKKEHS